ncbi:DNA polymerase epsilon subunit B2 [Perilla frutescens var. frutescens]|nr:DNA polymerase epsilon subunit B2 [Perilla frutescens var. frutescens]
MLLDGIFQVKTCGFPTFEDREKSLAMFAGVDFFGGGSLTKEEAVRLAELERGAVNDMFVILSYDWLDNEEKTMEKLDTILSGYENENVVPSLFVFMGTSVLIHVTFLLILTLASVAKEKRRWTFEVTKYATERSIALKCRCKWLSN